MCLYKHADLNLIPKTHVKSQVQWHTLAIPALEMRELEMGGSLGLLVQPS